MIGGLASQLDKNNPAVKPAARWRKPTEATVNAGVRFITNSGVLAWRSYPSRSRRRIFGQCPESCKGANVIAKRGVQVLDPATSG